jgi:spore germination protein
VKKVWISSLLLVLFIITTLVPGISALSYPSISIDGKVRNFNPPPIIANDRTMVPVRFVVEDESLQGKVYWDGNTRKIAMDCRGKYIEFYIGSTSAKVDGKSITFDAAPFIYQDRTYVPLRFLAETLGATVTWDSKIQRVNINFNYQPRVFAYYYYSSREELLDNIELFTDIAFRWFETDAYGHLTYEYKDEYDELLSLARKNKIKTHASVALMDGDALHNLLANPENRKLLIGNLLNEVKVHGYDGVNIDFEFIKASDSSYFNTFLSELKTALGSKKELSVAVFARTEDDKWPTAYDYARIGEIADRVVVMAYDYHYRTGPAGPVAPLWWVENVVDYMTAKIPAAKIMLGMATYGYDWASNGSCQTITAPKLNNILSQYRVEEHFDKTSMSPYYTYWDENGNFHEIWMENEMSLSKKWEEAVTNRLGGISFWRIGNGFDDLYTVLENNGI